MYIICYFQLNWAGEFFFSLDYMHVDVIYLIFICDDLLAFLFSFFATLIFLILFGSYSIIGL